VGILINWWSFGQAMDDVETGRRKRRRGRPSELRQEPKPIPTPNEQELVQRIVQMPELSDHVRSVRIHPHAFRPRTDDG
jgi:hypothetical protein